jgi:hypothetical protein
MVSCVGVDIVELERQETVSFSVWRFAGCAAVFVFRICPPPSAHSSISITKVGFLLHLWCGKVTESRKNRLWD